jgi:hypothetical protein
MKPAASHMTIDRTTQRSAAGPSTLIAGMVKELLAKIDPKGYDRLLAGFLEEYQPSGAVEQGLVEDLAYVSWRLRGCSAMEAEIRRKGMQINGPDLLSELSIFETRLQNDLRRTLKALSWTGGGRRREAAIAAAARLAKLRPCTSVIQ